MASSERYAIAHVTPYPWEAQDNEVNAHIATAATELSRRGHRVLVVAPSRSQERVRASRRTLWATRGRPSALLEGTDTGTPSVIAVGEVLDLPSLTSGNGTRPQSRRAPALPIDVARTIEELLGIAPLDIVHVHEPLVPSASAAALRHSRALNVGSFYATASERGVIPALVGRRVMNTLFGRLDARIDGRRQPDANELEAIYRELAARRHDPDGDPALARRLAGRQLIDVDLHMHTDHSHDCATPVEVLLATARERGLGVIAVTDHNEISGALAARERARELDIGVQVIVGEEIKTAQQGEVIGLFIEELIPRGLTLEQTIAEIHRQGGLAYVPHPFDRMHAVPDYEHLLPVVADIDAIEVFNARVAIGAFNDEAARFAAKYRIPGGAGSDAHVAQGLGSVRIRMREFDGPAEFMQSLRDADILSRPTSLLYVQALKFLQTRATPPSARRASRARRVKRALGGSRRT
jgi:PHP-associated/PHP domain